MTKSLLLGLILLSLPGSRLLAQTVSEDTPGGAPAADSSPTPAAEKKAAQAPQGPTVIDSDSMDYYGKTDIAVFNGADYGVLIKSPSFTVYCDKMTAHMRKANATASPAPGTPAAKAPPKGNPATTTTTGTSSGGGLQEAIAEGNADRPVVIIQDKPAANGQAAQHNVGIALKADYHADTGDVILTGWPRVSQGINTQIATAPYTVMTMNRDGQTTMTTRGPSRTVIQEQDQPKKTGTDSDASSPSPPPQ